MPPLTSPSPTSAPLPTNNDKEDNESTAASAAQQEQFFKLPDFYSTTLNLLILGYIRPEFDYVSRDALVEDIRVDCEVARKSLERDGYVQYLSDAYAAGGRECNDMADKKDSAAEERVWLRTFKP